MEKINILLYKLQTVIVNQFKLVLTRYPCFKGLFLTYCIDVPDEGVRLRNEGLYSRWTQDH
jgi:hypothetical protein